MKKFAITLCLLLLFPAQTLAGNWQNSGTNADDCAGLGRACSAAAKELKAARELIAGYEEHIIAANDRIEVAKREIEALKSINALESERAVELANVIAAERDAKAVLVKLKAEQEKRIAKLEKQLKRSRKFALIAVVAAGVAILVGAAK